MLSFVQNENIQYIEHFKIGFVSMLVVNVIENIWHEYHLNLFAVDKERNNGFDKFIIIIPIKMIYR